MKNALRLAILLAAIGIGACGTTSTADFPNRLIGADGQLFVLEDLIEIANDPNLADDDARRDAFRALGIEDETLIEALLDLQ